MPRLGATRQVVSDALCRVKTSPAADKGKLYLRNVAHYVLTSPVNLVYVTLKPVFLDCTARLSVSEFYRTWRIFL